MDAKEFIKQKGCEHDGSFVPISEVYRLMESYASQMPSISDKEIEDWANDLSIRELPTILNTVVPVTYVDEKAKLFLIAGAKHMKYWIKSLQQKNQKED